MGRGAGDGRRRGVGVGSGRACGEVELVGRPEAQRDLRVWRERVEMVVGREDVECKAGAERDCHHEGHPVGEVLHHLLRGDHEHCDRGGWGIQHA